MINLSLLRPSISCTCDAKLLNMERHFLPPPLPPLPPPLLSPLPPPLPPLPPPPLLPYLLFLFLFSHSGSSLKGIGGREEYRFVLLSFCPSLCPLDQQGCILLRGEGEMQDKIDGEENARLGEKSKADKGDDNNNNKRIYFLHIRKQQINTGNETGGGTPLSQQIQQNT